MRESQKTCLDVSRTVFGVKTMCGLMCPLIPSLPVKAGIFFYHWMNTVGTSRAARISVSKDRHGYINEKIFYHHGSSDANRKRCLRR